DLGGDRVSGRSRPRLALRRLGTCGQFHPRRPPRRATTAERRRRDRSGTATQPRAERHGRPERAHNLGPYGGEYGLHATGYWPHSFDGTHARHVAAGTAALSQQDPPSPYNYVL